jgi:hypothetical protein
MFTTLPLCRNEANHRKSRLFQPTPQNFDDTLTGFSGATGGGGVGNGCATGCGNGCATGCGCGAADADLQQNPNAAVTVHTNCHYYCYCCYYRHHHH